MRVGEARELFRQLTKEYFAGAAVAFTRQSRQPKADLPLVTLTPGNVKRPNAPNYETVNGTIVGNYLSRLTITIDLFTHGSPIKDEDTGQILAYENTALDDMLAFADYLNSEHTVQWCDRKDVSILIDGDAQDLTGIVNDTTYEYRSRLTVFLYFTQKAIGAASVASEVSILYPTGEIDEFGEPIYAPGEPVETESASGDFRDETDEEIIPVVKTEFEQSSSGGGSKELADKQVGWFNEVEFTEGGSSNE